MSEAHSNQLLYLFIFIAILIFVIFGTIAFSQMKKKKSADQIASLPPQNPFKIIPTAPEVVHTSDLASTEKEKAPRKLILVELEPETNLKTALKKTEESFFGRIKKAFSSQDKKIVLEQIEEVLYTSD